MSTLKIEAAVLCDQVRTENNGKQILIGVYGQNIVFAFLPATLALFLWTRVMPEKAGQIKSELRVVGPHELIMAKANLITNIPKAGLASMSVIGPLQLTFQSEGIVKFQIREEGCDWETALEIPVAQTKVPGSPIVVAPSAPSH